MKINNSQPLRFKNNLKQSTPSEKIAFKASPEEILEKLESTRICPCKGKFLRNITTFFTEAQDQMTKMADAPDEFTYQLGEKNIIPDSMKKIEVDGMSLQGIDKILSEDSFNCSSGSCKSQNNQGKFISDLLNLIGVEKPEVITITKSRRR